VEHAIEIFAAINFLILGLSHVFQPRAWAEFFVRLREWGRPGAFANGFLTLITGSLIVAFHNVWSWPGVLLTAIGYSMLLKSLVVFVRPDLDREAREDRRRRRDAHCRRRVPGILRVAGVSERGGLAS
jgi:hypothetical protein